jgi:cellulose synthase/poly-beta-1,6-N-acetylglucosamine synthase-like glycosyltransferase
MISSQIPGRCEARRRLLLWQAVFLLCVIAIIVYAFVFGSLFWRTVLISCWIGLYTFNNLYRYWLAGESVLIAKKKIPLNPPLTRGTFEGEILQEELLWARTDANQIATPQAPRNDMESAERKVLLSDKELPVCTILLPLRNEADVAGQLMSAINALDYPRNKLQVLCLLRRDDAGTLAAIETAAREQNCEVQYQPVIPANAEIQETYGPKSTFSIPSECAGFAHWIPACPTRGCAGMTNTECTGNSLQFTVLFLPENLPVGTKPAACNWGLAHATGEILVIYDAEDIPDPGQLREAAALLKTLPDNVAGVQSAKKVYNGNTNWLTRLYELEALTWHHLQLPGVMEYEKMAPLHGSGVHLRTKVLLAMNGWDYYNVAEDCDLGVRLQRHGYHLVPFDSITGEEAPSTFRGWMGQRTRWNKGYIQSFLVHWRNPKKLWRELGFRRVLAFATLTGITWLNLLIGLPTWIGVLIWGAIYQWNRSTFSGAANIIEIRLLIGSAIILLLMAAALQVAGAVVVRQWKLVPYGLLAPFYWILLGIAVWRSLWQLCVSPFSWEKTMHG